jgi:hypothetical protein
MFGLRDRHNYRFLDSSARSLVSPTASQCFQLPMSSLIYAVFCDLAVLCPLQLPLVLLFSQRIKQLWKTESLLIWWQESYRSLDVGKSVYALYSHCMSPIIICPDAQTGALPQLRSHLLQLFVETHDAASPFVALPATDTVRRIAPNMQNIV